MWEFSAYALAKQSGEPNGVILNGNDSFSNGVLVEVSVAQENPLIKEEVLSKIVFYNVETGLLEIPGINSDIVNTIEFNGIVLVPTRFNTLIELPKD